LNENRKYLDPKLLSKLGSIDLVARCAVEGLFSGLHPSPFHGFSVEYSDHRAYQVGDELKFLDWKMFGRSDKLYVKQFKQETNVFVYILLDTSLSMSFAGDGSVSKLDYASFLTAALSYLMLGQGDAVSLDLFSEKIITHIPSHSRRTHLNTLLTAVGHNKPQGRTNLAGVLHAVAEMNHRRGLVILISDLLDDQDDIYKGLAHLNYLNHDVIIFHTLDRQELELDYEGLVEFTDLETRQRLRAFPKSLQEEYRKRVQEFIDNVSKTAGKNEIDYCLLNTSEPLDKGLLTYLAKRKQMM
jgi:uncharacterized protein (DUF58 family)